MIKAFTGITTESAFHKPYATAPQRKLEFLQNKDVFFSSQSYRAQVAHFLNSPPKQPLLLTFMTPEQNAFWDWLAPNKQREVLMAIPVEAEPIRQTAANSVEEEPEPALNAKASAQDGTALQSDAEIDYLADDILIGDDGLQPVGKSNPFAQNLAGAANPFGEVKMPPPVAETVTQAEKPKSHNIRILNMSGTMIEPQRFFQLEQAFKHAGLDRATPAWISQKGEDLQVISGNDPVKAGYQNHTKPFLGSLNRVFARMIAPFLGIKINGNTMTLPNGSQRALMPSYWTDAGGQRAQVYRAVGLADGTWMRLNDQPAEETVPFRDQKRLRQAIEDKVRSYEFLGKVRDIPAAWSFMPQQPPIVPQA